MRDSHTLNLKMGDCSSFVVSISVSLTQWYYSNENIGGVEARMKVAEEKDEKSIVRGTSSCILCSTPG